MFNYTPKMNIPFLTSDSFMDAVLCIAICQQISACHSCPASATTEYLLFNIINLDILKASVY